MDVDLPPKIIDIMKNHPEVDWNQVISTYIENYVSERKIVKKSLKKRIQNVSGMIKEKYPEPNDIKKIWEPIIE